MPATMKPRRFPAPWTVKEMEESFVVQDATGQPLAYLYFDEHPQRRSVTKRLSRDEARRIAVNIVKLRACCVNSSAGATGELRQAAGPAAAMAVVRSHSRRSSNAICG